MSRLSDPQDRIYDIVALEETRHNAEVYDVDPQMASLPKHINKAYYKV